MSDLISRQDALEAICTWDKFGVNELGRVVRWYEGLEPYVHLGDVVWAIEKLPSVQSAQKGWICPVCGRGLSPLTMVCPCNNVKGWEFTCKT